MSSRALRPYALLLYLFLGGLPSFLWAYEEDVLVKIEPAKILRENKQSLVISLPEALQKALSHHGLLQIAKVKRDIFNNEYWMRVGAILPKLTLASSYTHNIPKKEFALFDVKQASNLNRQVAGLLRKSGDGVAADQLDQQADYLVRRDADKTLIANPKDVINARLSLEVPLFHGLGIARILSSHEQVLAYDVKVLAQRADTVYKTAEAYFLALYYQDIVLILNDEMNLIEKKIPIRGDARHKANRAIAAKNLRMRADSLQARLSYRQSIGTLGVMMGEMEEFKPITPNTTSFAALNNDINDDIENLVIKAMRERLDVKANSHAQGALAYEKWGHYLSFIPSLGLRGDAFYTSNNKTVIGEHVTYAISLNATMPIFEGGISLLSLRQNSLMLKELHIEQREILTTTDSTIRSHKETLVVLLAKEKALKAELDIQEESWRNMLNTAKNSGDYEKIISASDDKIASSIKYKKCQYDINRVKLMLMRELSLLETLLE